MPPAAYTLKPSKQSTLLASGGLENVAFSSPILSDYISPTSLLEHIRSRRGITAPTSVEDAASNSAQAVTSTSAISSDVSSAKDGEPRTASIKSADVDTTVTKSNEFQLISSIARPTQSRASAPVYLAASESHTQVSHDIVTPALHILNTDLSHLTASAFQSNDEHLSSTQTNHIGITNSLFPRAPSTFPYWASDLSASIEETMSQVISSSTQQWANPSTMHKSGTAQDVLSTPTSIDLFPSSLPASDAYFLTRASMISEDVFSRNETIVMPNTEILSSEMSPHSSLAPTSVPDIISPNSKSFPISSELSLWQIKLSPSEISAPHLTNSLFLPIASLFDNETLMYFSHDLEKTTSPAILSTLLPQESSMPLETVASELNSQNSSRVLQAEASDLNFTTVDLTSLMPSSTIQNIESFSPRVSITNKAVGESIASQEETPYFSSTTVDFIYLMPSSTEQNIESLTPGYSIAETVGGSMTSQIETPDFRPTTMEFISLMVSSTNQNIEILTAGVGFTAAASVLQLQSSDIFDMPHNTSSDKSNMDSPSFYAESTVLTSMKPSLTTQTSLGTGLSHDLISDVNIASLSHFLDIEISQSHATAVSSSLIFKPTLPVSDYHESSSMELNTSEESFVSSLVDPSVPLSATSDVEISLLEVSLRSSEQIPFILSSTHTVSGSIYRDISMLTSNVIPYQTPTPTSKTPNPTSSQQISDETFQLFTTPANLESDTRSLSSSITASATALNVSLAYSLSTNATTIDITPTTSFIAVQVSSTRKSETSMIPVTHSSLPNTTSPIPAVTALTDVTFAFSFTVNGQCLTLRQVPYSRHLKTSLARMLLYLTRLKRQKGTKVSVGEAQCNTKPHVISVSFFEVDKQSLLQVLNSTQMFYGNKHKHFSRPIEVKFSAESKTFVVKITGFEEIKKLGQSRSKGSIFGIDTAAIATAACLCVVLFCVGTCIFAREVYLKRRADCMNVSGRSSPALTFKAKAAELTHTSGMYKGGKTGIDNPALCSSVYNDLEMTELHLGDTDDDDDSSYYNPYDVEYSSIGNNFMVEFDAFGTSGNLHGIMNSAFSLSSVEDDSNNRTINDHSKNGAIDLEKQSGQSAPPLRNYGLVIGLLGYNKQQVRQPRPEEKTSSWSPEEQLPNASHEKKQRGQERNEGNIPAENIYAVPMKYPRKSRQNSRKRPSLRAMMSAPPLASETPLSLPMEKEQKPSPVPPPRRQKKAARPHQEQKIAKHDGRGKAGTQRSVKAQRSVSRDDISKSGRVNRSFVEDEGYAVISGSTQSFHF